MFRKRREDRRALVGRLYDAHGAALYRYALMLLADHGGAEDAVQQVFAAVLRGSEAIEHELHYLRRAIRNECYSAARRGRPARLDDERQLLEAATHEPVSSDERILLERALITLPSDQREVIHLHVFEGMTFQETADATGESINTIASRYRYAIAKLRSAIAEKV